ncbi:BZ3500_MvSof-1268-A1-R1_Chr4-2g07025 [Microbotryum saponariae]|uniref:BZ3500_MvSof-1268-A1-R1_Chr4-2g07025 protein n=1 Tax=Microbotryum saponariae TaxID=289078 RepID=A0A2X0LN00_9BASI|nr:BZ3500_MvSof-1268-A1-R1_Chr4-2g07025 [Microbotryum saponariae]SDA06690.1 BZ3501_MvSof-1269-A2-R1_Chr4-2g06736 [Microbotryum saponariae]
MKEAPTPLAWRTNSPIPNGWADPNFARDKPASSSRHPKGSSWKLCNEYGTNFLKKWLQHAAISLQHVFVECQPSSCFPPPSTGDSAFVSYHLTSAVQSGMTEKLIRKTDIGSSGTGGDPIPEKRGHPSWPAWENDIDAHKNPIFYNNAREGSRPRENTAEGLTSKTGSGSVDCGSPSRGRSSTARFGGVTVVLIRWDPKRCLPVIPSHRLHKSSTLASWNADFWGEVEVLHLSANKSNTSDIEQFWRPKINDMVLDLLPGDAQTFYSPDSVVENEDESLFSIEYLQSQHRRDGVAPHSTRVLTTV